MARGHRSQLKKFLFHPWPLSLSTVVLLELLGEAAKWWRSHDGGDGAGNRIWHPDQPRREREAATGGGERGVAPAAALLIPLAAAGDGRERERDRGASTTRTKLCVLDAATATLGGVVSP